MNFEDLIPLVNLPVVRYRNLEFQKAIKKYLFLVLHFTDKKQHKNSNFTLLKLFLQNLTTLKNF